MDLADNSGNPYKPRKANWAYSHQIADNRKCYNFYTCMNIVANM